VIGRNRKRQNKEAAPTSSVSSEGAGSGVMTRTYCSCIAASSMMRPSLAIASAVVMVCTAGGACAVMAAG
jgi:hypothetical protein